MLLLIMTACSEEEKADDDVPQIVEVEILLPEDISVGEAVTLSSYISQGGEDVNDADDVTFEIWEESASDEDHDRILAEFDQDGTYSISYTFETAGTYHIISHVNAREMHVMPEEIIEVKE